MDDEEKRSAVLVTILSTIPPRTAISPHDERGFLGNALDSQLTRVLFQATKDKPEGMIDQLFAFHPVYGDSRELDELLDAYIDFGRPNLGLDNFGPDYTYEITSRTHEIAERVQGLFSEEEVSYLKELGQKIVYKPKI